jgi:hypothetical protein
MTRRSVGWAKAQHSVCDVLANGLRALPTLDYANAMDASAIKIQLVA